MVYNTDYDDVNFTNERLPAPDFTDLLGPSSGAGGSAVLLHSSAHFYRDESNANIEITAPLGVDIAPGIIYLSSNLYLSNNTFNLTNPITEIIYPDSKDVRILMDGEFLHDILVQFKITKSDGTNFSNCRTLRVALVQEDGTTLYSNGLKSDNQPDSNVHDMAIIKGTITHNLNDLIRLKFNIVQNNGRADMNDSKLTIFKISWNILGLKTS